jgi:DNA-binding CsgD family transcriptional regulator
METAGERLCWFVRAVAARAAGDPEFAVRILDQLLETTPNIAGSRIVPRHALLRGQALTDLERYPDAEAALRAARSAAKEFGYRPILWRTWLALGTLYTAWDRSDDATDCFAEGRIIVEALAETISDMTSRGIFLQNALGQFPAPRKLTVLQAAKQESGGLTARQRDVAMLIAHGYTNAQIAGEMSISKRTVEGHVSGIMTTLNFSSRAQIAAWTINQGLVQLP